jgi:hypothetical protein
MLPLSVLLDAWIDVTTGCFKPVFDNYIYLATLGVMANGAQETQLAILAPSFNTPPLLASAYAMAFSP